MGLGSSENDLIVDDSDGVTVGSGGGGGGYGKGSVSCSICLEAVTDSGDRSWAKLQCGHQFHLDCIGSAFNIKGAMQCPNCRKTEKGQWLYASGSRSLPEINVDDWTHDEDVYYSVSEVSLGVHYCPFGGGLARFPPLIEEGDFSLNAYHDQLLAQHAAASVISSNCPYIAYFGPVHPSSSSSSTGAVGAISDTSNFNWNPPPSVEMPGSYGFHAIDLHYNNSWEHQSPPFSTTTGRVDQPSLPPNPLRVSRSNVGPQRAAGSFMHSSSGARVGSSIPQTVTPTYPGSNARARNRAQAFQEYYQGASPTPNYAPMISSARRHASHNRARGSQATASLADQPSGFYFVPGGNYQEAGTAATRGRFREWETLSRGDSGWEGLYQQENNGPEAGTTITGSLRQRYGSSERSSSQNRS